MTDVRRARAIIEYGLADDEELTGRKIHDQYCRCRACKPPLVGQQRMEATRRIEVAVLIGLVICFIAGVVQFCGLSS